ncbi:MAG: SBBP repeat-containing protein [Bacteroidetes bacterium]|nr:SBBP repeat-containing protein [Bacteroidota bacterium]
MNKLILPFLFLHLFSFAQITEQWARKYSSYGDYSAKYTCVAKDLSGNLYVGGYTVTIDNNRDYLVAKLNLFGDTLWTRIFRGTDNSGDEVKAIAVDKNANVYVTGFANGKGTGNDILTIKLNTNGDTLWKRFYNHTAKDDDNGNSIAVDTSGNVFVCGESDGNASNIDNFDYITLKYDANGNQLWANRYGITGTDKAVKVVCDRAGNCYVTGRIYNGIDDNFATIKYTAAGVQQWLKTYDGGSSDRAADMAIDSAFAFVYVTGRSDNGSNDDMVTLKYGVAAGTLAWTKVYNNVDDDRGIAITVDASANVYVTGESDADASVNRNWNFVTVKYASNSTQQWVRTYNSSATNPDIPIGVCVNTAGDVFVAGQSDVDPNSINTNYVFTTLKYNSGGTQQWVKTFSGNAVSTGGAEALMLNNSGFAVVVGSSENTLTQKDAFAICYDAAGVELWNNSYSGSGDNSDNAYKVFVDAAENSYLAGYSISEETDRNMTTLKVNALGDTQWVRNYNGTSSISIDAANDIKSDAAGNVFVTGSAKNAGSSNDFVTIKYNSVGDSVWVKRYNNALVNGSDKANALDIDASGNVYVTGYSETTNGTLSDDFLTIKYDPSGIQQWALKYNGTGNGEDRATAIKVSQNFVFVCGKVWNGTNFDYGFRSYSLSGSPLSGGVYDGAFGDDVPSGMVIDAAENVYITGKSASSLGNLYSDYATAKFNSNGTLLWVKRYNGPNNLNDEANGIAIDQSANVFVTGVSDDDPIGLNQSANFATIAYNSNGDSLWTRIYNGASNLNDAAKAIAVDNVGTSYITGEVNNGTASVPNLDVFTIKYDFTGLSLVTAAYNGTGNGKDSPNSITIKNDNVFVCGESFSNASAQKDLILLKYDDFTLGTKQVSNKSTRFTVFPNPASGSFVLSAKQASFSKKNTFFVLFNQLGEEVKRIEIKDQAKQSIQIDNFQAGIYSFQILQDGISIDYGKIAIQ